MSSEEKIWEKPDPRIKWALDLLDGNEGYEQGGIINYFFYPSLFGGVMGLSNVFRNIALRRPTHTAVHISVFMAVGGWLAGVAFRNRLEQKNVNDLAAIKHYLMLHPEKFPEPEKKKFGDKEVFLEWPINR